MVRWLHQQRAPTHVIELQFIPCRTTTFSSFNLPLVIHSGDSKSPAAAAFPPIHLPNCISFAPLFPLEFAAFHCGLGEFDRVTRGTNYSSACNCFQKTGYNMLACVPVNGFVLSVFFFYLTNSDCRRHVPLPPCLLFISANAAPTVLTSTLTRLRRANFPPRIIKVASYPTSQRQNDGSRRRKIALLPACCLAVAAVFYP